MSPSWAAGLGAPTPDTLEYEKLKHHIANLQANPPILAATERNRNISAFSVEQIKNGYLLKVGGYVIFCEDPAEVGNQVMAHLAGKVLGS